MLMQISSAHGPLECQLAAANALRRLQAADAQRVVVTVLDAQPGERPGTLRSALLDLDGEGALADRWTGTLQWICAKPVPVAPSRRTGSSASRAAPTRNRCRMAMCGSKRCAHAGGRPAREQDELRDSCDPCRDRPVGARGSERSQHARTSGAAVAAGSTAAGGRPSRVRCAPAAADAALCAGARQPRARVLRAAFVPAD